MQINQLTATPARLRPFCALWEEAISLRSDKQPLSPAPPFRREQPGKGAAARAAGSLGKVAGAGFSCLSLIPVCAVVGAQH